MAVVNLAAAIMSAREEEICVDATGKQKGLPLWPDKWRGKEQLWKGKKWRMILMSSLPCSSCLSLVNISSKRRKGFLSWICLNMFPSGTSKLIWLPFAHTVFNDNAVKCELMWRSETVSHYTFGKYSVNEIVNLSEKNFCCSTKATQVFSKFVKRETFLSRSESIFFRTSLEAFRCQIFIPNHRNRPNSEIPYLRLIPNSPPEKKFHPSYIGKIFRGTGAYRIRAPPRQDR